MYLLLITDYNVLKKVQGKVISLQAWCGPEDG